MDILLSPPIAFLVYIPLTLVLFWFGKTLAGKEKANPVKTSLYGSGEEPPTQVAAPGYQPFFLIAFFFAVLHLGILVVGSGGLNPLQGVYLVGLLVGLAALLLG